MNWPPACKIKLINHHFFLRFSFGALYIQNIQAFGQARSLDVNSAFSSIGYQNPHKVSDSILERNIYFSLGQSKNPDSIGSGGNLNFRSSFINDC